MEQAERLPASRASSNPYQIVLSHFCPDRLIDRASSAHRPVVADGGSRTALEDTC